MMQPPPPPPPQPQQWGVIPPPAPQQQYGQPPPQAPAQQMWPQQPYYAAPAPSPAQLQVLPGEVKTLWIGDLQYWMDEAYVYNCFLQTGEVQSVKLIRDKVTGNLQGYGFIEFATRAMAEQVLQAYNGQLMPNTEQAFRLNWASAGEKRDDSPGYSIFVGDLAAEVTDYILQETFKIHYPSVRGAKVVTDKMTGRSKGYGFVKFGDPTEQARAMNEMNGMVCSTRPMRIGPATNKKALELQTNVTAPTIQSLDQHENDPNNTTIFVGGLDPNVSEEELKQYFSPYGDLIHVKIPVGKRCGFVQFANRVNAEEALMVLQGTQIGGQKVRLSWGRSPSNKQPQQDPNQWGAAGGSYYGYGQGFDAYGYGQAAPQDPNMYAYQGYPNYQQPHQPQQ